MARTPEEARSWARQVVLDVLDVRISRKLTPGLYIEEDAVWRAVRYMEDIAPDWLLAQLEDPRFPSEGKLEVVVNMAKHAERARRLIGFEGTLEEFTPHTVKILGDPE